MAEDEQKAWWRQPRWWVMGAGLLLTLIVADVMLAFILPPRVASHIDTVAEQLKAEADLRSAILSLLGALTPLVALIAGIAALLNFQETRRQNVASLAVTLRGQVTERFTKAISQLGDNKLGIRIGGIYALEQIAKDSEDLRWPVLQTLTAYVREHSKLPADKGGQQTEQAAVADGESRAPADYLAVADVIRRSRWQWDPTVSLDERGRVWRQPLNLESSDLRQADLREAQLESADFQGAQLNGAVFAGARLESADFQGAQLESADFVEAQLQRASFGKAQLEGANFSGAELGKANFGGAQLRLARFKRARLEGAVFEGAKVGSADFREAQLSSVRFRGAWLERADFTEAQLNRATFVRAPLKRATFVRAQLAEADFEGAQLQGAHFEGAQLKGTIFTEAQIEGTNFEGVDLSQAEGLRQDQLD